VPTHDNEGKEFSKSAYKKLKKDWEKQKRLYEDWEKASKAGGGGSDASK
jgi:cysteinyl-tRNA synthetase